MCCSAQTLVTGASGFVGSAVARTLVGAGFRLRALVRRGSPRFHLDGLDLEFVEGDIRDADSVRRAIAGVRYVFHVAADYRLWARDRREIYAANVDGTRNRDARGAFAPASSASFTPAASPRWVCGPTARLRTNP